MHRADTTATARAAQALGGIVTMGVGIAAYDWRAGLVAVGLALLATSGVWRQ